MNDRQLRKQPSTVAMFRMSAVMWNAHRIHFDHEYATGVEGLPGLLVPANLLSSYVCELAMGWCGPRTRLRRLDFRPVAPVLAGADLAVRGREVRREPAADDPASDDVELELWIEVAAGGDPPPDEDAPTIAVRAGATVRVRRPDSDRQRSE